MIRQSLTVAGAALLLGCLSGSLVAQAPASVAVRDSFRIGDAGVLCTAQIQPLDKNVKGIFDRGYGVVCRDAASTVGHLYALRANVGSVAAVIASQADAMTCEAPVATTLGNVSSVSESVCTSQEKGLKYKSYSVVRGKTTYVAVGLAGYDAALRLGLQTLVADRPVAGNIEVATTAAGDPAAFARVQAGTLDADAALSQAYLRNNEGSFAEASEFFETLTERDASGSGERSAEYLANVAMQQSNLGNFSAADKLFGQADNRLSAGDALTSRLLRNYRSMHVLNQRKPDEAIALLDRAMPPVERGADADLAGGTISPTLANQINRQNASLEVLGGVDTRLRPYERAAILDGQAEQLRGVALRMKGDYDAALGALAKSNTALGSVRNGQVASTAFIRSETMGEMALISEARGDMPHAEQQFREAQQLLEIDYPKSIAALAAKARHAAFLARQGKADESLELYGAVVTDSQGMAGSSTAIGSMLGPYFALLAPRVEADPKAASAMFAASQVMVRPGVAQTQAVFARELSGGDDEASSLFRQSVTLSRDVARTSGEVSRLVAAKTGDAESPELVAARQRLTALEQDQTALQSRLADYPRYRVLSPQLLEVAELQRMLKPTEAYYQMRVVDRDIYALVVTPTSVRAAKADIDFRTLEFDVRTLRDTIVRMENGEPATYPFNLKLARKLYLALFAPFDDILAGTTGLVYEPDGPMLELPANLLPMRQADVDAYYTRIKNPKADDYDFRGVQWLGKDRDVTTAVSARSFADIRSIPPSRAKQAYLGLGHNAIPSRDVALFRRPAPGDTADCEWPIDNWGNPISEAELGIAQRAFSREGAQLITGAAFSDTALRERTDLNDFRILHFATHGLVTAPSAQCPARPALLTSFGAQGSDGLLSFREIYDLKLDADLVILSACDTAGMATVEATRDAGIATGGNFALDGLVRAFVGAGARSIIASHWPIPDDYNATKRLMTSLFDAPSGTPVGTALRNGQRLLMDSAETSHPFYWSAFAIVGDSTQPLLPAGDQQTAMLAPHRDQ
ncbi:CHAT domain-containing protein [Sphingomonas crocodyli]|uniref:CHAT domain-containing protein n=1 Tax=Sphingomonas crocodyli TaxID=1979270 RepID=A0A437LXL1_9SPHN|nr:CHAT domain-containing protein [Sphingomonas crocodyli]RVT90140.1 CHAT domain-containing protein [Sphingomonas crocodyli]